MVAKIVPFLFRAPRSSDWTQEEIAEFYRIEHALVHARLQVETDRGLSDEGEPWFAFCRGDGEVLVHIARDGSGYLMHAAGLRAPIKAGRLVDLARTFIEQFRVGATLEQAATGSTLLIHPVAMLAMVICAIFAANDDGISLGASAAAADSSTGAEQPTASLSGTLAIHQSFEKVLASVLGPASALEAHKDSVYLTIVCSIVATIGVVAPMPEETTAAVDLVQAVEVREEHAIAATPDFSDGESGLAFDASPQHITASSSLAVADLLQEPAEDTVVAMPSLSPSRVGAASFVDERPSLGDDDISPARVDSWRADPGAMSQPVVLAHAAPEAATATPTGGSSSSSSAARLELATPTVKPGMGLIEEFSAAKVDQLLHLLAKGPQPTAPESHPESEFIEAPPGIAEALSQILGGSGDAPHFSASQVTYYASFDQAARNTLVDFLVAFPNAPVVFSPQQIVIYDGAKEFDAAHLTVRVWELDSGQTIALVGHADSPAAHTGSVV